jgi:hypothetical protein
MQFNEATAPNQLSSLNRTASSFSHLSPCVNKQKLFHLGEILGGVVDAFQLLCAARAVTSNVRDGVSAQAQQQEQQEQPMIDDVPSTIVSSLLLSASRSSSM